MTNQVQQWKLARILAVTFLSIATQSAKSQTYTESVLYSFAGTPDGANSNAGLVRDSAGNLYGTTGAGGTSSIGTVFKLNASDKESVLYSFQGVPDGSEPSAGLVRDSAGNLYGTTSYGGNTSCVFNSCGTVFKVSKSGAETVLYRFCSATNCADGDFPQAGLIRDASGNLYGTTEYGGDFNCSPPYGCGTVFELTPSGSETVLHSFTGTDGESPYGGLVMDASGNLYGTTTFGGTSTACSGGCGVIFKLSSTGTETVLYSFTGPDGRNPYGSLVRDTKGNLYGTTFNGGASETGCGGDGCGTVFKLTPSGAETVLYSFTGATGTGSHPVAGLVRDTSGNLYGTAAWGGGTGCAAYSGCGMVFEIESNGKMIVLHSFTGASDGGLPEGELVRDTKGNLYGTTAIGGDLTCNVGLPGTGCGVVFKLVP